MISFVLKIGTTPNLVAYKLGTIRQLTNTKYSVLWGLRMEICHICLLQLLYNMEYELTTRKNRHPEW